MSDKKAGLSIFNALKRTAPMVFKRAPGMYLTYIIITIIHGAMWGVTAPANQVLYDALADLAVGKGLLSSVYLGAALVTVVLLAQQIFNGLHNFLYEYIFERVGGQLSRFIHAKTGRLPVQLFEDKEKLDDINKANEGKSGAIHLFNTMSDMVFFYGSYYGVMVVYLWKMQPTLVVAFIFIFLPVAISQVVRTKMFDKLEKESAPLRRQYTHYEECLIGKDRMKETRLFGAYSFFKKLYMDTVTLLAEKEWSVRKKITLIEWGLNIIKAAGWVGVIWLLFNALVKGSISVGAFAAVFSSIGMLFMILEEVFGRIGWNVSANVGKIHNFIHFLDFPEANNETGEPDFAQGIVLTDVRFTYPATDKPVIDGVTLTIKPGETVALVGENGSGKTTLVKLLMGLFKPESGIITIGGRDAAKTADASLFAKTSSVFQQYQHYIFNLRQNVNISDYRSGAEVNPVLDSADVNYQDTDTFPKGLETVLSREYEGVELSGGQWQRVAMARGLYRPHEFMVLDEPTAAIDPLEETRVYKRFAQLAQDKTAVVVTHRLGSARIADRILVMDAGKIVESGTHEQLLAAKGKYAALWDAQAGSYVDPISAR